MPIYEQFCERKENESYTAARHLANLSKLCNLRRHCIIWLGFLKIGNFWYKFSPKGYIPFSDFYKIWRGGGSPS